MEDIRLKFIALFWRTLAFIYILARWAVDGGFSGVGVLLSLSSQLLHTYFCVLRTATSNKT